MQARRCLSVEPTGEYRTNLNLLGLGRGGIYWFFGVDLIECLEQGGDPMSR